MPTAIACQHLKRHADQARSARGNAAQVMYGMRLYIPFLGALDAPLASTKQKHSCVISSQTFYQLLYLDGVSRRTAASIGANLQFRVTFYHSTSFCLMKLESRVLLSKLTDHNISSTCRLEEAAQAMQLPI
jgi:hypothetical protein